MTTEPRSTEPRSAGASPAEAARPAAAQPDSARLPVAVLGATGLVGRRLVARLARHPWFKPAALFASERSAGRAYGELVPDAANLPADTAALTVRACAWSGTDMAVHETLVFSALGADVARELEPALASAGALVVTNASAFRMDPRVPLVVPEVNPDHLALAASRPFGRGAILANPNCSTIGLVLALAPLHAAFGIRRVHVVTLQARSGAGLAGLQDETLTGDVVPFIAGEEEKLERETARILGLDLPISAACHRVDVTHGHTLAVSVELETEVETAALAQAFEAFVAPADVAALPSAPRRVIELVAEADGPRPVRDVDRGDGMAVSIGRLRPCPILGHRFVTLSHNAERGAAGGTLLLAELARARGLLGDLLERGDT